MAKRGEAEQSPPPFSAETMRKEDDQDHSVAKQDEEEKWVKHYSSFHQILLVGEGDFSFSTCLAQSFGSACNIVASSLDTYDNAVKKYKQAKNNFDLLEKLGAAVLHEVDATKMNVNANLKMRKFERIIYNFPHAGFYGKEDHIHVIKKHRELLSGFFKNASGMLRANGEVHVNHKIGHPYCKWNLEELASQNHLYLADFVPFRKEDYPGYSNKRGSGLNCDKSFPLGDCCTYKFVFSPTAKKAYRLKMKKMALPSGISQQHVKAPIHVPQQPNAFEFRQQPTLVPQPRNTFEFRQLVPNIVTYTNSSPGLAPYRRCGELLEPSIYAPQMPNYFESNHSQPNFAPLGGGNRRSVGPSLTVSISVEYCSRIFGVDCGYVVDALLRYDNNALHFLDKNVVEALLRHDPNAFYFLPKVLGQGYESYMAEKPGRTLRGYISMLVELCQFYVAKQERSRRMLEELKYFNQLA